MAHFIFQKLPLILDCLKLLVLYLYLTEKEEVIAIHLFHRYGRLERAYELAIDLQAKDLFMVSSNGSTRNCLEA